MTGRIYFILGMTFVTGMFAGAYLYVTSFAPDYQKDTVEELAEVDFRIQGQMTGGCAMNGVCPSFLLKQNRMYEYMPTYRLQDGEPEKVTGKMDIESFKLIVAQVQSSQMNILTKENTLSCNSYVDGIDYEYQVTLDGEMYSLSTCGMNFKNSALDQTFRPLWSQLTLSNNEAGLFEDGISGFFRNQLDKKFEYDD